MGRHNSPAANSGLAKVAVQCSADTFVVNQSFVLRINICGKKTPPSPSLKTSGCEKTQNPLKYNFPLLSKNSYLTLDDSYF
jgi:hypothetical protein